MAKIEIDGKKFDAAIGDMIREVADAAGIHIPRFCYHKKLSIAANCRMCLVEVTNMNKTVPACATPVADGMQIFTTSKRTQDSQKAVMDFLLINHPLDCPICDHGGECELQDLSVGYGADATNFAEEKRVVNDPDIGSLITTNMTRCIHCTRCIRFGEEIAGKQELGLLHRGDSSEVRVSLNESVHSNISGNLIDICPVGALNSKPYRFQARGWELKQTSSIAPHDCLGANIHIHSRNDEVLRVVSHENPDFNDTWISDRDRFSYLGLRHEQRCETPLVKTENIWRKQSWSMALDVASSKLQKFVAKHGGNKLSGVISPKSTTEEMFMFQKLLRGLESNNIDHRLRRLDFDGQENMPICTTSLLSSNDIEKSDRILLVGVNVPDEEPLLSVRIRAAIRRGAKVFVINPYDYQLNLEVEQKFIVSPSKMLNVLQQLTFSNESTNGNDTQITNVNSLMQNGEKSLIIYGAIATQHKDAAILKSLVINLSNKYHSKLLSLTNGANSVGAWLSGCLPHRKAGGVKIPEKNVGMHFQDMFAQEGNAYLLYGVEPEFDCHTPKKVMDALDDAPLVIVFTTYVTSRMKEYADIILPITPYTEMSGSFFNVFGKCQKFDAAVKNYKDSRPGWKVLRVMANMLDIADCDYFAASELRDELQELLKTTPFKKTDTYKIPATLPIEDEWSIISEWPIYSVDSLVRRSYSLQEINHMAKGVFRINQVSANGLNMDDGKELTIKCDDLKLTLPVLIDDRVPDNCIYVPSGINESMTMNYTGKVSIVSIV